MKNIQKRPYAVFDIDGTLVRWQLYHSVVDELAKEGHLAADAAKVIREARMTWKNRTHRDSFHDYELVLIKTYLAALTNLRVADYDQAVDKVFETYKDQVYTFTRDLIRSLKQQNYLLFAVSGSQSEIVKKLANYYGFDGAVGTLYEQKNGYFTGHETSFIADKSAALSSMLQDFDTTDAGSLAVGDSASDISLLARVERPIAFNPAADLYEKALCEHWQIVVERKNVIYQLEPKDGSYFLA